MCCPDLPDTFLVDVPLVSGCGSGKGLEGLGVGDKALDLFLDRDDKLFSVGCAEGLCSFDFLCVASVVFDGIGAHIRGGGFSRSMISRTARMSCGL